MGFGRFVKAVATGGTSEAAKQAKANKRGALALVTGGVSETTGFGKKLLGSAGPSGRLEEPEGGTIQPFDVGAITRGLKQTQAVTGRAVSPGAIEAATKGVIGAQLNPAVLAAERAKERALDIKKFNIRSEIEAGAAKTAGGAALGSLAGAGVGALFGGPAGAGVGAEAGKGAGGILANVSVLCTELRRQGIITRRLAKLATVYRVKHIEMDVYEGYLIWATPLTKLMQRSRIITWLVSLFWVPVTFEMAHRENPEIKSGWTGRLLYEGLSLFSRAVYYVCMDRRTLWVR